jgi:lysine-ketoglutarate reductase/saccharopine dehydrogenase-like protein (TIGR00300 family)
MCAPEKFDIDYNINPWMEGNIHNLSRELATTQWQKLYDTLAEYAEIELITPQAGLPDLVFTANAGLVVGDKVIISSFYHAERQGEEPHFRDWFDKHGFEVHQLSSQLSFEGAGDALIDRSGDWLWAGYGWRTELESHNYIADWLDIEVLSLRLVDRRFYHLDTCFCPLSDGYLLYYPPAFDRHSNQLIESRIPPNKRIIVGETDAIQFACNSVNIDDLVVMNFASEGLQQRLAAVGFKVAITPLSEFLKAGGAAKCLTLKLTESLAISLPEVIAGKTTTNLPVEVRQIQLSGHLLDSGLMNRALDRIVEAGGSFQVLKFDLGEQRQSISTAEVKVSTPNHQVMADILAQLIDLGAIILPSGSENDSQTPSADARLVAVTQTGVAPEDFYVTNIYPTEIRVQGEWVRAKQQRMDGAIVVSYPSGETVATCKLLRDLQVGELVVVDAIGMRTIHKPETRTSSSGEFSFMSAGVSSERRVELVVEQVAWELQRIRQRGGRSAIVAGPVVIHTGGGEHLAELIRDGYIQVLLGGNAIAVHDIEQSMYGTSLGVDLQRGIPLSGGHRHHLKVINTIRKYGSIEAAVKAGIITSGIFYECVQKNVPFALAGSIRDDGPLPDTQMDLIKAQQEYAKAIEGADLILMLSSMLHSIGVGNMTPAGVKLVCVDINPAVVTKLSDRGSIESTGVVTDVGLFLSLLVQQLNRMS